MYITADLEGLMNPGKYKTCKCIFYTCQEVEVQILRQITLPLSFGEEGD